MLKRRHETPRPHIGRPVWLKSGSRTRCRTARPHEARTRHVGWRLGVGAGVGAGSPTGFSFALRTEELHTFSTLFGWELSDTQFHAHGDYQIPIAELNPAESILAITFYTGVGATMDIDKSLGFGARVPIVAEIGFDKRLEVFIELAPVIGVLPDGEMGMQGTMGVRGWFRPKPSNGNGAEVGSE